MFKGWLDEEELIREESVSYVGEKLRNIGVLEVK